MADWLCVRLQSGTGGFDFLSRLSAPETRIGILCRTSQTIWSKAVINGDLHSLQRIIEERRFRGVFDINARWNDWTLLTLAAREDRREIARCLLGNGADANVTCKNGWTALMGAATNSSIQMTRLLVGNGAKVNMTDDGGITALMQAALNGNLEVVKLLLERDANINAVARDGQTALENTIPNNNIEIAKYLVNKGAELACPV